MKKNVEIFTVKRQWVTSYNHDYVSQFVLPNMVRYSKDGFFSSEEMTMKEIQLRITPFYNKEPNGEVIERLCAFDNDLMCLIGCMQEQKDREIYDAARKAKQQAEEELKPSLDKLAKYESMSFYSKLKFVGTGKIS